ncbi:MAG TPA: YdeI/OmpD-associated family protein [Anaerolineales bacterium]|nr:YdeI/OmpD-associated family protein [Anaerolineales bacterium]
MVRNITTLPRNSVHPKTGAEWRKWLEENHARPDGIWLMSYKKAIPEWIISAKKPETLLRQVEEAVTKAEKNICANQWRQ